ncbi:MAG: hypothetical protein Q8R59_08415 [Polaromonas sp.]|nr:hypothetical protein [Polaromonas sp.]
MLRIRRFLLCLMMLALPLQGFAAAAMLYCGPGQAHQAMQTQAATQDSLQSHDHNVATMQHDHHAQPIDTAAQTQTDQAQAQLPDATHKCGVCAACCSVLALTDVAHAIAVPSLPPSDLAEPFVLIDTVPSRQPEKPPRA